MPFYFALCYYQSINEMSGYNMELDTNNHSVFLLYYHLILITKYRRQVIDDEISDYAKVTFEQIAKPYHITLVEWNHDKDQFISCLKRSLKLSWQNLSMLIKMPFHV